MLTEGHEVNELLSQVTRHVSEYSWEEGQESPKRVSSQLPEGQPGTTQ